MIDGNAMKSLEMRFQKADVAIYFRFSIFICMWCVLKRALQRNWHIPDLAEGCTKSVRFRLIKYMFRFHSRYSPKMDELRQKYPHVRFYILKSNKEANRFLKAVESLQFAKTSKIER